MFRSRKCFIFIFRIGVVDVTIGFLRRQVQTVSESQSRWVFESNMSAKLLRFSIVHSVLSNLELAKVWTDRDRPFELKILRPERELHGHCQ
jgi:hypothetical protein